MGPNQWANQKIILFLKYDLIVYKINKLVTPRLRNMIRRLVLFSPIRRLQISNNFLDKKTGKSDLEKKRETGKNEPRKETTGKNEPGENKKTEKISMAQAQSILDEINKARRIGQDKGLD